MVSTAVTDNMEHDGVTIMRRTQVRTNVILLNI